MEDTPEERSFPLPEQRDFDYGYGEAFRIAGEKLLSFADLEAQCRKSGASLQLADAQHLITLPYINRDYQVHLPEISVSMAHDAQKVPLRDQILILHYLIQARGTPLSNQMISYKELPEGAVYFPSFYKRAIGPVVECFGRCPEKLLEAAALLGGIPANYGSAGVKIPAFPRVPVIVLLWQADAEFSAEGSILFDSSISDYLSTEDIHILCQAITWRLVRGSKG